MVLFGVGWVVRTVAAVCSFGLELRQHACEKYPPRSGHPRPGGRRLDYHARSLSHPYGDRRLFIDLGAERLLIGAQRESERIAVEIASFVADSRVRDLQEAVGQFVVYRALLAQAEPARLLFLGVPARVYDSVLSEPLGQLVVADVRLRLMVFDAQQQQVVRWIN
jgi:hypothetical protein